MGIYDRDYLRPQGGGFWAAMAGRGQVVKWLIIVNGVLFFLQALSAPGGRHSDPLTSWLALDGTWVLRGQVWRLVTYAFVHADLWPILWNMLWLWFVGRDVEDIYGPREFLAFYFAAALLGGLGFFLTQPVSGVPFLGSSVTALSVMVLATLYYPSRTIIFIIIPMPMWVATLILVAFDTYALLPALREQNAALAPAAVAHLAGAGFAFVYFKRRWRILDFWNSLRLWQRRLSRPRLRLYGDEPVRTAAANRAPTNLAGDERIDAEVDRVLEKVARSGQGSLTETERQILMRASEVYRRRRT